MNQKYVQQFKKGSLEMVLLSLIARKETYGYEIIAELNQRGASVLGYAKEGTVYPILYRLQETGLLQCRIVPAVNRSSKKYYSLTEAGETTLREMINFWGDYTKCINCFIGEQD